MSGKEKDIVNWEDQEKLFLIDPLFIEIHEQYGNPPNWNRPKGFESLGRIILEQQVSLESGKAVYHKLLEEIGEFTPENILSLSDEEMRAAYVSRQKSSYLKGLAQAVLDGSFPLDELANMDFDECRAHLLAIKGIGNWTADIYQMICLQEKDIFPPGDVAIVNSIRHLTPLQDVEEILAETEKWRPYRSLASFYFWHHHLSKSGRTVIY